CAVLKVPAPGLAPPDPSASETAGPDRCWTLTLPLLEGCLPATPANVYGNGRTAASSARSLPFWSVGGAGFRVATTGGFSSGLSEEVSAAEELFESSRSKPAT